MVLYMIWKRNSGKLVMELWNNLNAMGTIGSAMDVRKSSERISIKKLLYHYFWFAPIAFPIAPIAVELLKTNIGKTRYR